MRCAFCTVGERCTYLPATEGDGLEILMEGKSLVVLVALHLLYRFTGQGNVGVRSPSDRRKLSLGLTSETIRNRPDVDGVFVISGEAYVGGCDLDEDYPRLRRNFRELELRVNLLEFLFLSLFPLIHAFIVLRHDVT